MSRLFIRHGTRDACVDMVSYCCFMSWWEHVCLFQRPPCRLSCTAPDCYPASSCVVSVYRAIR